ncbi:CENP-B N-terminal DNA-binding domain [Popillia japonica]|uniref:CENP-B N-terminal DNA-binding domain n=1 Tax=Popillia japonica TaxID=7064 RepID=A0AAW1N4M5_POPJA
MNRSHTNEDLEKAVSAIREGGLSIRKSERTYQIPFNTIRRRVNGSVDMHCKRPRPQSLLGAECEKDIYEAVVQLQKMGHGLTTKEVLKLAGDIDAKREIKVFKNEWPSKRWYKSFMMRHNLTLRQPENLSAARNGKD